MKTDPLITTFPKPEIGKEMKGAEAVIDCLVR